MMESISCCKWFLILHLLFSAVVSAKHHGNPANELVNIINQNRTLAKLPQLNDNAGLSCIALQYIEHCQGNCTSNNTLKCKPSENNFTEIFAPNCGVELPTFGTITGRIVGCQSKYVEPLEAFSRVLVRDHKTLSVLRDKNHSEVGVGLIGNHHGPYFWCVLFSNDRINSTFVLDNGGKGIKQRKGCYSGANIDCNEGKRTKIFFLVSIFSVIFTIFI
ncbi:hypothetical protein C5167_019601 [Papaver somniferum]|uniref:SCP domain-containing protein n=1 Tax=Papaver somniferum TaxID=3469 RepID=A0A4Y7IUK3_PAPSO|nr:uncharacterized protein LOC113353911 [Papaver somniferum]XP_026453168.1 uncharacterized protein LOC113353911 [Papaver somniferum]RZC51179.1 hypothetical protein C5167_019601 [Papaver somniferum]